MHGWCDTRTTDTFTPAERHRPLAGTKLYYLVTEAHGCEQLAHSWWLPGIGRIISQTCDLSIVTNYHYATKPQGKQKLWTIQIRQI